MNRPLLLLALAVACFGCDGAAPGPGDPAQEQALEGPYLGQDPPGSHPKLFAPDIVSTGLHTRDVAMTPQGDEIYFSVQAGPFAAVVGTRMENDTWTPPEVAPFSSDPATMEIEPHISPDGAHLFFVSNRAPDGTALAPTERGRFERADIWVVDRSESGWGEARRLPAPVNTDAPEYFPSTTRSGTLYFTREEEGSGRNFIYRARAQGSGYVEPELLPEQVNSANQFNAFVSPDESFLILGVFGREDSVGGTDYYVVFRDEDDNWSEPINLGPEINQPRGAEWSPYVSPDGRYFFFMSTRAPYPDRAPEQLTFDGLRRFHAGPESGNPAIYWVDAGFLEELRAQAWR